MLFDLKHVSGSLITAQSISYYYPICPTIGIGKTLYTNNIIQKVHITLWITTTTYGK